MRSPKTTLLLQQSGNIITYGLTSSEWIYAAYTSKVYHLFICTFFSGKSRCYQPTVKVRTPPQAYKKNSTETTDKITIFWNVTPCTRGLRRGSAAARLLKLRVRIPSGEWMSGSFECCVCSQVEVSATGRSLVQRSPTECGGSKCDLETSTMRGLRPTRAVKPRKKEKLVSVFCLHSKVVRLV
jgi:hypothetical protein